MANENTFKDLLESVGTSIDDKESVSAIMKSLLSARNILSQNDLDIIAVLLTDKNLDASSKAEMICQMCRETGGKKSGNACDKVKLSCEMIAVKGGTFIRTVVVYEDVLNYDDVTEDVEVAVGSFEIGKYPVTQELYESVRGINTSKFKGKKLPMESVSWYDAIEFCNDLSCKDGLKPCYSIGLNSQIKCDFTANGYRLPTKAEWEFAARGGNKSKVALGGKHGRNYFCNSNYHSRIGTSVTKHTCNWTCFKNHYFSSRNYLRNKTIVMMEMG